MLRIGIVETPADLIRRLEDLGFAYGGGGGDVFFRVRRFPGYGKLSGQRLEDMEAGARIEVDPNKEDPLDFVLWKASKPGEPAWDSPWGPGRPGWHIECSAMSMHYLGETLDLHGGGQDLVFPHHENELAQSEAATGRPFARFWLHHGLLTINQEKMSKSLGNFFTVKEVLARFPAEVVRFFLISSHYRSPLDFSDAALFAAHSGHQKISDAVRTLRKLLESAPQGEADKGVLAQLDQAKAKKMLQDAGFTLPVKITVAYRKSDTQDKVFAGLKTAWDAAGFDTQLDGFSAKYYSTIQSPAAAAKYDAMWAGWGADYPSASTVIQSLPASQTTYWIGSG